MRYSFLLILIPILLIGGCFMDEDLYLTGIHNETGESFFEGNCTNGVVVIHSDGSMICRDENTFYYEFGFNDTAPLGGGDLNIFMNSSETNGYTYYYLIGDDDLK